MEKDKKSYIAGVDIGSSNVVIAVGTLQEDGLLNIEGVASRAVEHGGVNAGRIENVRAVGAAIKDAKLELENELGIRINEAYAGISGDFMCATYTDHVFVKDTQGRITAEDVAELHERMNNVLAPDGEQIIDRIPQNYMVDNREIDNPDGAFGRILASTFLFTLCRKEQIERVKLSFHNAGLQLSDICINPVALPAALLSDVERDEGVAIVDLGGGTTDITIVRKGKIRYVASLPIGGSTIDSDIHAFGIPDKQVEKIKKLYGMAIAEMAPSDCCIQIQMPAQQKRDVPQVNLVSVIEARLKDITEFVWADIREAKSTTKIPCGFVLTGGSALLENIDELFHRETKLPARLCKTIYGINEESQQAIGTFAHLSAVAILLFGAGKGQCDVVVRRPNQAEQPRRPEPRVNPYNAAVSPASPARRPAEEKRSEQVGAAQGVAETVPPTRESADDDVATKAEAKPADSVTASGDTTLTVATEEEHGESNNGKNFFTRLNEWFDNILDNKNRDEDYL